MTRLSGTAPVDAAGAAERALRQRSAPGLELRDLQDAASFLEAMGLLLQTPHPYLPSLFGAAQGEPAKPGVAGFGQWPEHAWSWAGELAEREDVLLTKVILRRRTLVHRRLWPALDAAVRSRRPEGADAVAIAAALERTSATRTDELRALAKLDEKADGKRYDQALLALESQGIVSCRPVLVDHHKHVSLASLWSTRFPHALAHPPGVHAFVLAAVEAAGAVPLREVLKWFAWPRAEVSGAIEELERAGQLVKVDGNRLIKAT